MRSGVKWRAARSAFPTWTAWPSWRRAVVSSSMVAGVCPRPCRQMKMRISAGADHVAPDCAGPLARERNEAGGMQRIAENDADPLSALRRPELFVGIVAAAKIEFGHALPVDQFAKRQGGE